MATYLVTGVAGFIGSNLAEQLLARGERVRGIDNFSTGKRVNIGHLPELDMIEGDINDDATLRRAFLDVEYVLHEAAIPSVPRSVEAPVESHHANVNGTLAVLEMARRTGKVKRVVYAASSSAYGDTPTLPKHEEMPHKPLSPYAVNKLVGELYCSVYTRIFGVPCVALRYFNIFGPRQDPESRYAAVIPKFVRAILSNEPPPIYGDGEQTRDFTFIDNVVHANLLACAAQKAPGEVFNVGCGTRVSLLQLCETINEVLGKAVAPQHLEPRAADVRDSLASLEKAQATLGYEPQVPLREGLERYIHWFRAQSRGSGR